MKVRAPAIEAAMLAAIAAAQQPNGYLSAFPEEFFDRLRAGRPVWAPFYTLHKIMAGLLDQHTLMGDAQALESSLIRVPLAPWAWPGWPGRFFLPRRPSPGPSGAPGPAPR